MGGDANSIDATIDTLYACMSFAPGALPDYARLQTLFLPGASLLPPSDEEDPVPAMDLATFVETSRAAFASSEALQERGFVEAEIARRVERFGSIVQVLSTFEVRYPDAHGPPLGRGVNSLQLVRRAERWWIVSLTWDDESPVTPLPQRYLSSP